MKPVTPERWGRWLGEMPMPEDATEDMMWAAFGSIREMERRDEAIEGITYFTYLVERDKEQLKTAEVWEDTEKADAIKDCIKIGKEIVNTYRSWLQ